MEYHQFSLNSLISVRKLNGKACSQEKVRVYFPHQIEKRQLRHHLGQWMSLDTLIATGEFASILSACIIWPEIGPKREGMNWRGWKSVCSIYGGLWSACPYTHPAPKWAPCSSLCLGWGSKVPWSMPEPSLCARRAALSLQNTDKAVFNLQPQHRIFSERGADGSRRQSISSCLVPAAQRILLAQPSSRGWLPAQCRHRLSY